MRFSPGCCCPGDDDETECLCPHCEGTGTNAPCCLGVTIAGVTAGPCNCFWCDDLNGDYQALYAGNCIWSGRICSDQKQYAACGFELLRVTLVKEGADYIVRVQVSKTDSRTQGFGLLTWEKNYGPTKPLCHDWAGEQIPFKQSQGLDRFTCTGVGSTAMLTALPGKANTTDCPNGISCLHRQVCLSCHQGRRPAELIVTIPNGWVVNRHPDGCLSGTFALTTNGGCGYEYRLPTFGQPGRWQSVAAQFRGGRNGFVVAPCELIVSTGFGLGKVGADDTITCTFTIAWIASIGELCGGCDQDAEFPWCGKCDCLTGPWSVPFRQEIKTPQCAVECSWGGAPVQVSPLGVLP